MALKLKLNTAEPGFWVSGVAHAALFGAALFAVSAPALPDAQEGIPVEIITDNQFSEITKGETSAKQVQPTPKPRADRVADKVEQRDPGEEKRDVPAPPTRPAEMKVAEKEEPAAAAPPPPPPPAPAQRAEAEAKARAEEARRLEEKAEAEAIEQRRVEEAKAKAEAEARAAKAKAEAEARAKAVAEAQAKAKAEAEAKARAEAEAKRVAEAKAKAEAEAAAKRQVELAEKFNPGDIRQLLQSKERAQSSGATGSEVQKTASLGSATGTAAKLNPSQRDALMGLLREQMERCYQAPISASAGNATAPVLDIRLNQDGSLTTEPQILRAGSSSTDRAVADAALRAVRRCAPFRVPAQFAPFYSDWKVLNVQFDLS